MIGSLRVHHVEAELLGQSYSGFAVGELQVKVSHGVVRARS